MLSVAQPIFDTFVNCNWVAARWQ